MQIRTQAFSMLTRRAGLALGVLCAASLMCGTSLAQEWKPAKPIHLLVGFTPGGSADILARLIQVPMSQKLGVPVVVENVPGASGNIAMAQLARAAPDGYTIGMGYVGSHAISPALLGNKLQFRVPEDFTPITQLVSQPNVLLVNKSVPANTIGEFIAWLKANPGQSFGTAGVGTSNHLSGELVALRYGVKLVHIPYKGAAPVLTDLLGGHIPMTLDQVTTAVKLANEGRARALAVTSIKRSPQLPNVPTLAESGAPGFDLYSWQGLFGPRGLPAEVTAKLYDATLAALNDAAVRKALIEFGSDIGGQPPEQFATFVIQEKKKWGDIVRDANVKAE